MNVKNIELFVKIVSITLKVRVTTVLTLNNAIMEVATLSGAIAANESDDERNESIISHSEYHCIVHIRLG